jgi:hypothetical protein
MATRPVSSIADQLTAGHLIIQNSINDPEIMDLVGEFGYDAAKLNAALTLYNTARAAVELQKNKAGDQQNATQAFNEAQKTAFDAYQALAKVARAVFSADPAQLTMLGLTGGMPKDNPSFFNAAYTLFDNASGNEALAEVGYDAAKLTSERLKIAAMSTADLAQEAAKGAAQQATAEQDAAMQALNDWVGQYRKIAKVALRGKKQLLEKIGITARSSKTDAQRAAPAKAAATRAAKKNQ